MLLELTAIDRSSDNVVARGAFMYKLAGVTENAEIKVQTFPGMNPSKLLISYNEVDADLVPWRDNFVTINGFNSSVSEPSVIQWWLVSD